MTWWVYLARSRDGAIYTGVSTDVKRRIREHNSKKGSKALRGKRPITLACSEKYPNRSKAQKREAEIKRWPRVKKLALIAAARRPLGYGGLRRARRV